METKDDITLVAPCGLYCKDCAVYKVKNDPSLGEILTEKFGWNGIPCQGCRTIKGKSQFINEICPTYACAAERGLDFCFECSDFPCGKLNPTADRAGELPHNIKVFNLCYIKEQGLSKFKQNASDIKKKYLHGKMVLGRGPRLE